jgi:PAS domain S-box-containing protein
VTRVPRRPAITTQTSRVAASFLAIAQAVGETYDLTESLRKVCRELSRLTGAETVSAHLRDPATEELRPVAAYHVPREALEALANTPLSLADQGFTADVFTAGAVVWSDDVPNDPRFVSPLFRRFPHQSGIVVPLALDEAPAALFYLVWWRERRRPDEAEIATLQGVARQVGTLLRVARLTRALERRNELLARSARVSQRISAALDLDTVLDEIALASAWLVDAPVAYLWLADEESRTLDLRAVSDAGLGADLTVRRLGFGEGGVGWIAEHRLPLDVPDVFADDRLVALDWARAHGLQSFYGVPIVGGGRLLAVLGLNGRQPVRLGRDEAEVLDVFVAHAGTSVRNAQLFHESQERRRAAEALASVARALATSLDLPTVTDRIVQSVRPTLGVASAGIRLVEPDGSLRLVAADEETRAVFAIGHTTPPGSGATGRAVTEGRTVTSREMLLDPALAFDEDVRGRNRAAGYRAILAAPLRVGAEVIGALYVADPRPRAFPEDTVALFEAFADHAAIAIQNARLYETATTRAERQRVLVRINQLVSSSLDLDTLLDAIARAARTLLGVPLAMVWVVEESARLLTVRTLSTPGWDLDFVPRTLAFGEGGMGWIALHRQPLDIADVFADRRFLASEWWRSHGLRSFRGVPVTVDDRLVAVLGLGAHAPIRLDDDQEALLSSFVAQAATAVRNAELYRLATRRAERMRALASVERIVSEALDPRLVAESIVDTLRSLLDAQVATVYEVDESTGGFRLLAVSGDVRPSDELDIVLPRGAGVVGLAIAEGCPVTTPDVLEDPRVSMTPDVRRRIEAAGYRAVLACPLVAHGRTIGGLGVGDRRNRAFDPEDVDLAQAFADQAAIALWNSAIFAAERSARDRAEEALVAVREHEARLRALVDDSPIGVYIHQDGIIRFANGALAEMAGYPSPAELVGEPWTILLPPEEQARMESIRRARLRGEAAPRRYEAENVRRDGARYWVENWGTVVTWAGAPAILVTFVDITERKRAQAAVEEREERLRRTQKLEAIGKLAGGVAHDFNNVLAIVRGHADLLSGRLPEEPRTRRSLDAIIGASERGARLTHQLLAFSRKQVLKPRIVDLNEVVAGLEMLLRRVINEDIELVSHLAPDLGRVEADVSQLEQVVLNLVINARDAMPSGGQILIATADVTLDGETAGTLGVAAGPYVELTVSDTGIGMSPEVQAHIFEPFFTTKAPGHGTGLGLATVYGIVRQSGGAITVDSRQGERTTFWIYIPRAAALPDGPAPVAVRERPRGAGETILLVEDEEELRFLMSAVLETAGYRVLQVSDGAEALEVSARHPEPIHLLAADVIMPGMSGTELARRLTRDRPAVRVLYMSGHTAEALSVHGVAGSGVTLIEKPFATDDLLRVVRGVLDQR